jgi:hypothetical protein
MVPSTERGKRMNVKEQIAILQSAITQLEQYDPDTNISGHVSYPDGCYSGDLDGDIYKIEIESPPSDEDLLEMDEEEKEMYDGVVVGVYSE